MKSCDFRHSGCTDGTSNDAALHRKQGSVWCQSQRTCAKGCYDLSWRSLEPLTICLQHAKWNGIDQCTNDVFFAIDHTYPSCSSRDFKRYSDWKHENKFILSNSTCVIYHTFLRVWFCFLIKRREFCNFRNYFVDYIQIVFCKIIYTLNNQIFRDL